MTNSKETPRIGRPPSATLAEAFPDIAAQLLDPSLGDTLSRGSGQLVWWKCDKGHQWEAKVFNRTNAKRPTGCPVCSGKQIIAGVNDIATTHPDAAALFADQEQARTTTAFSNTKVSLRCPQGHTWKAPPSRLTYQGSGCPSCAKEEARANAAERAALRLPPNSDEQSPQPTPFAAVEDHDSESDKTTAAQAHLISATPAGKHPQRTLRINHFDDRVWLTVPEWATYLRRLPVRYIKTRQQVIDRDGPNCSICGEGESSGKPLQLAHRIGFQTGVVKWGLTPDWLDRVENIALAHRGRCNNSVELDALQIAHLLDSSGFDLDQSPAVQLHMTHLTRDKQGHISAVEFTPLHTK